MGITFDYVSVLEVDDSTRARVSARAAELTHDYEWWAEPLCFFESKHFGKRMAGATKFACMIDSDDCIAVENFMGAQDIEKIVSVLETLSTEFSLDWDLSLEGGSLGSIHRGKRQGEVKELISSMHDEALEEFVELGIEPDEINRESILARFRDR